MNWDTAPQELDALRAQVAALTMDLDHWRYQADEAGVTRVLLGGKIAAAQAHIAQLREALEAMVLAAREHRMGLRIADEALAISTDTTALDARLAQERERCAVVAEKSEWIAAQIRSLK